MGQDRLYWTDRVNRHLETVQDSLDNLRQLTTNAASIEALDSAVDAVSDLARLDGRAREHVNLEQPLLASDLIFTDGLELVARAATNIELARANERTTRNDIVRVVRSSQVTVLATATTVGVIAILLLIPMKGEKNSFSFAATGSGEPTVEVATNPEQSGESLEILDAVSPGTVERSSVHEDDEPSTSTSEPSPATTTAGPVPIPDLLVAADLCTDLCKVTETEDLPELLARAATLMNASGIIIWVRNSSGNSLRPAIGHGYTQQALARLGSIPEHGHNATAAAYRSARMQVVARDNTSGGALAAPLLTAHGCVGVLSAELREGWESSEAVQATAAIMAAQLATLLSADPPTETATSKAEAHG